jgi:hypothetical protein
MMNYIRNGRVIISTTVVLLLIILGTALFITLDRMNKTAVSLNIFPNDAHMTINDQSVKSGTVYLKPGTYTIKASRGGFEDESKTITVEKSEQTVAMIMIPASEAAKQWVQDHQVEYNQIQGLGEKVAHEKGKEFNNRNPIAKDLPYRTFIYTIGYQADPTDPSGNSIILTIDAPEGYRQAALYRIRQLGYDPTDFNIIFRDYENPFPL